MKKIITLILGLCLCFALMGCGGSDGSSERSSVSSGVLGTVAPSQNENVISYNENTGLLYVPLLEKKNIEQKLSIKGKEVRVSVTYDFGGHALVNDFNVNTPYVKFTPGSKSRVYFAKVELDNGRKYLCQIIVKYL